jgi:hypothetical protein
MRAALGMLVVAVVATPADALSIVARRAHTTDRACAATKDFLAHILDGRSKALPLGIRIQSDALGTVQYDQREAFSTSLTENDGKRDRVSAKVNALVAIHSDKFDPLYLAVIERDRWQAQRYFEDADGEAEQLPPAYETHHSFWLVTFSSDEISSFREVGELYPLAFSGKFRDVCG